MKRCQATAPAPSAGNRTRFGTEEMNRRSKYELFLKAQEREAVGDYARAYLDYYAAGALKSARKMREACALSYVLGATS